MKILTDTPTGCRFCSLRSKFLIYAFESKSSILDTLNVHEKSTQEIIPTIIGAIRINPKISLEELAGLIGKSKRTIQRIIKNSA